MRYLNKEELKIATRFLYLSMAIKVIEQDLEHVSSGPFKIKEPYLALLNKMLYLAMSERKNLRFKMREQAIKVVHLNKNDSFSTYSFIAGKREETRNYFNPAIRKQVVLIFEEVMIEAGRQVQTYVSSHH